MKKDIGKKKIGLALVSILCQLLFILQPQMRGQAEEKYVEAEIKPEELALGEYVEAEIEPEELALGEEEADLPTEIAVEKIEVADFETELEVGKTVTLSATVLPADAANSTITYTSSNPAVAAVSATGEVKGLSAGQVTITLFAGGVSKNVELKVKVATRAIRTNSNYIVLKLGESLTLEAEVIPKAANQLLSYKTMDAEIATVTEQGSIRALKSGSTAIVVTNGDITNVVTVIVNERKAQKNTKNESLEKKGTKQKALNSETAVAEKIRKQAATEIELAKCKILSKEILKQLYKSGNTLLISSPAYEIKISGKDIVNFENELDLIIPMIEDSKGLKFELNSGEHLPGRMTMSLSGAAEYKYLYLYNDTKKRYELLKEEDLLNLNLNAAGNYLLTEERLQGKFKGIFIVPIFLCILLAGIISYLLVEKGYLFW